MRDTEPFPSTDTTFLLEGPAGHIEVATTPAQDEKTRRPITAVICHPHPLHGGTMNNKVVSTLVRTFKELNIRCVKFNFRGVGKSDGVFDNGIAETDDVLTLVQWVKKISPDDKIWLAGFSFGAFVSARTATKIEVAQLVIIAPQVSRLIEDNLPEITCPWVLVQGEKDDITPANELCQWLNTRKHQPQLIKIPEAGHFFHGMLGELRGKLLEVLNKLNRLPSLQSFRSNITVTGDPLSETIRKARKEK